MYQKEETPSPHPDSCYVEHVFFVLLGIIAISPAGAAAGGLSNKIWPDTSMANRRLPQCVAQGSRPKVASV